MQPHAPRALAMLLFLLTGEQEGSFRLEIDWIGIDDT